MVPIKSSTGKHQYEVVKNILVSFDGAANTSEE